MLPNSFAQLRIEIYSMFGSSRDMHSASSREESVTELGAQPPAL